MFPPWILVSLYSAPEVIFNNKGVSFWLLTYCKTAPTLSSIQKTSCTTTFCSVLKITVWILLARRSDPFWRCAAQFTWRLCWCFWKTLPVRSRLHSSATMSLQEVILPARSKINGKPGRLRASIRATSSWVPLRRIEPDLRRHGPACGYGDGPGSVRPRATCARVGPLVGIDQGYI